MLHSSAALQPRARRNHPCSRCATVGMTRLLLLSAAPQQPLRRWSNRCVLCLAGLGHCSGTVLQWLQEVAAGLCCTDLAVGLLLLWKQQDEPPPAGWLAGSP